MARILLGVSGGIAAYKALGFVRLATAAGHAVRALQTPASRRFVGAASFAALTGAPVLVSEFERDPARGTFPDQAPPAHEPLGHLELVANADLYLIAPATANTIAKLAVGLAEDLVSSCALAAACPLVLAPAMNNRMYEHPAVRANLQTLRGRGVHVVEPDVGRLASRGEHGIGRLAEPARLLEACEQVLARRESWRGLRVLVTAGGTREPLDGVRFIGNSSSGRMGLALAEAARARGAQVTLVAANVALPAPGGVELLPVATAAELERACEQQFAACDVLLMAAAVADFRPAEPSQGKIKKSGRESLLVRLEPTSDVLAALSGRRRDGQTLVGFAAEHGAQGLDEARRKLLAKGLDAIVVNDVSRVDIGFDAADNEVTILTSDGPEHARTDGERSAGATETHALTIPRASKPEVAEAILDAVERLRGAR
jgi:phosphopantothenoylcysteine decarboxylase / phosphopantothenate---cysteine ligase